MGVFPVTPASLAAQPSILREHGGDTGSAPWLLPHQQSLRRGGVCRTHTGPVDTVPVPEPREASVPGHCPGPPSGRPPAQARAGGRALSAGLPSLFRSAVTAASQSTEDGAMGAGQGPGPAGQRLSPRGPASASRPGGRLLFRPYLAKTEPLPRQRRHLRGTGAEGDGRGEDGGRPKRGRPGVQGAVDGRTGRSARTQALEVSRRPTRHARPDRGERRSMRRSRRLTRAQTLPRVRNAALDCRDFSNGPPLLAATPHAHRRGSEKVQEAGCHAREPGWLRRARRPARCTRPTSRFPGALSAPSSLRGPSRRPRRTCRRRATAAHGRRGDAPGPRQGAAGNWHTVSREDERPRPRRLRADP